MRDWLRWRWEHRGGLILALIYILIGIFSVVLISKIDGAGWLAVISFALAVFFGGWIR